MFFDIFSPQISVLCWRIEELGAALRTHHGLEDFSSALLPAQASSFGPQIPFFKLNLFNFPLFYPFLQEPVTLLGQIACDSNGKLNAKSAVLEGDRQRSAGARVPLDLSELPEFSLFPGQVGISPKSPQNLSFLGFYPPFLFFFCFFRLWHWRGSTAPGRRWWCPSSTR